MTTTLKFNLMKTASALLIALFSVTAAIGSFGTVLIGLVGFGKRRKAASTNGE